MPSIYDDSFLAKASRKLRVSKLKKAKAIVSTAYTKVSSGYQTTKRVGKKVAKTSRQVSGFLGYPTKRKKKRIKKKVTTYYY